MSRSFDGIDDLIAVSDAASLDSFTAISVGGWVNRNGNQPDQDFGTMLLKLRVAQQPQYAIFIKDSVSGVGCRYRMNTNLSDSGLNVWEINFDFVSGQWHHVMWTWTSGGTPICYFNGIARALSSSNGSISGTTISTTDPLNIGNAQSSNALMYKGKLAHIQLHNVALTPNQVLQSMRYPGSVTVGLKGFWPLWGSSIEYDYSGNKNNGTNNNGVAVSTDNPPVNRVFGAKRPSLWHASFASTTTAGPVTSSVLFRKTLSGIGTRTGSRQVHGWGN